MWSTPALLHLRPTMSALMVVGIELGLIVLLCGAIHVVFRLVMRSARRQTGWAAAWSHTAHVKIRNLLLVSAFTGTTAVLLYNGWLLTRGVDVHAHTLDLLRSITLETQRAILIAMGKIAAASVAAMLITRVLHRLLHVLEAGINRWDQLKDNNKSLAVLFRGLNRAVVHVGWLLVIVLACGLVGAPENVTHACVLALRLYVVFAVGLAIVRSTTVVTDTLDGLSRRFAEARGWLRFYDSLRPLLPTLRVCLEYALWIAMASLIVVQLAPLQSFAVWGPRLIQAIGIFFAGRLVIELGRLELGHRLLPESGLDETERRRRATMVPLVRTAFTYCVYFGTAVLVLGSLGFNPMPFLAGAGILGLVVGFGAQSLINDVVSGFFILFENMYLVGETIEAGTVDYGWAKGVVEAIDFRTTKIRDGEGRLHVLRNGDMKPIVNYSRDFAVAVVDLNVGYDADLRVVFDGVRQAADRLRADHPDVLADTEIEGVVAFGTTHLTVRTQTRVRPGRSDAVGAALRFHIKDVFDRHSSGVYRRMLIPRALAGIDPPAAPAYES